MSLVIFIYRGLRMELHSLHQKILFSLARKIRKMIDARTIVTSVPLNGFTIVDRKNDKWMLVKHAFKLVASSWC